VTWLLLTGAGLVAETVVIVALGRSVTARYEPRRDALPPRSDPAARGSGRYVSSGLLDGQVVPAPRTDAGREAIT
jgi:hypothetical protein